MHHRVPFYETDAMGIVHHSNTVRYMEIARVAWLEEHDQPYTVYIESGHHFATTRVEVDYLRPVRFDDVVDVTVWLGIGGLWVALLLRQLTSWSLLPQNDPRLAEALEPAEAH